jgi:Ca2+-binding EF-hand superfamily protein
LNITEEKLNKYQSDFDYFDEDQDGKITKKDFNKLTIPITKSKNGNSSRMSDLIKEFDPNGDGYISFFEYVNFMENNKNEKQRNEKEKKIMEKNEQEVKIILKTTEKLTEIDTRENKKITKTNSPKKANSENIEDELLNAFKSFDVKEKDYITCLEFKYIITKLGNTYLRLDSSEVELLFSFCNLNPDGKLYYKDFIKKWRKPTI